MANSKGTVLVTGASGFLGSHIVTLLLAAGYSVRATARGAKVETLRKAFEGKDIEVIEIKDISKDDLTSTFTGLLAVIHAASPLAGRNPADVTLSATLDGTLNVLRHALKAGVTKVVLTSTWATFLDPELKQTYEGKTFDQNSWGEVTTEQILDGTHNPFYVYLASKIVTEKAAWKFAKENPQLDLATINPPFIYGPFTEGFTPGGPKEVGTNAFILGLITGEAGRPLPPVMSPYYIDVRDVARAHVAALDLPKVTSGPLEQKRFLISGGAFTWKEAAEYIAEARPELKSRLPDTSSGTTLPATLSKNDVSPAAKSLGLTEYIGWQKIITDTVDALLALQKKWAAASA